MVLYRPLARMGRLGRGSLILRPRRLRGLRCLTVGDGVVIDSGSWIAAYEQYRDSHYSPRIVIGDRTTIGRHFCLTAINRVEIGSDCLLSEYVYISDHFHGTDPNNGPPVTQPLVSKGGVKIGNSCFLGYRVSVLPGVTLGDHCVVGANSVVTKSFPAGSVIAGVPARIIKSSSAASHTQRSDAS